MFSTEVYVRRRKELHGKMKNGIALFIGNDESPMNYPANSYHFRQDSDFLYFFGPDLPGFAGIMDFDAGKDYLFADDFGVDDIVWMGPQPLVNDIAQKCGINESFPLAKLEEMIRDASGKKRQIHFLPPYRGETRMTIGRILRENPCQMKSLASVGLIKAVISMRSLKEEEELKEIDRAVDIAYEMHVAAMKKCRPGINEQEIFGTIEGIAMSKGWGTSFPSIVSMNGQTLHNHIHKYDLVKGRMLVVDAGAETNLHYASDITRTTPVGGKFSERQREIYEIVLNANMDAIAAARPGLSHRENHFMACRIIASGLKDLGLMKGDTDEAVRQGAHALFMPHGIGHMMGLDVHDMEGLGENYAGYNEEVKRSDQFGTAFLRFALPYKPGHVFTIEPGCYFIPELIEKWKAENKFTGFIDYGKIRDYMPIGGIRIEDNVAITEGGHRVLGKPIPKSIEEVEALF